MDHQVKLSGHRIELGEIEACPRGPAAVQEGVAAVREDRPGQPRLVAYLVPRPGAAPAAAELRSWLRESLPVHMVPADFVVMEALPLTPSGKLDRGALPAPEAAAAAPAGMGPAAPSGPWEEMLAGIWAELLGVDHGGPHQDFFAAGGHSFLATPLLSPVRSAFGVEVPLRALFEQPTIAGLARAVRTVRQERDGAVTPPLTRMPRGEILPASFAQRRLR